VIERALERHGITLTADDVLRMNQVIWNGDAVEFGRMKRKGRRFFVPAVDGVTLPVVYHTGFHSIITVLDSNSAEVLRALAKRSEYDLTRKDSQSNLGKAT
jgi:hypothetical protein